MDPLVIPGHGSKLIDHLLADVQPLADMGLFTNASLQSGIKLGRLGPQLNSGFLSHGRLTVGYLCHGCCILLLLALGLGLQVQHTTQQRVKMCLC